MKPYVTVFISQPMKNKSKDGIQRERKLIEDSLPKLLGEGDYVVMPMISEVTLSMNKPAHCLGSSIQDMSCSDIVVFAPGWRDARGCTIEHTVCLLYRIPYVELLKDDDEYYVSSDGRKFIPEDKEVFQ